MIKETKKKIWNVNITNQLGDFKEVWSELLRDNKWYIVKEWNKEIWKVLYNKYFTSTKDWELYLDAIESYNKWAWTKIIANLFKDNKINSIKFDALEDSIWFWEKLWARQTSDWYTLSKYEFLNYLSNWKIDKKFFEIYKK